MVGKVCVEPQTALLRQTYSDSNHRLKLPTLMGFFTSFSLFPPPPPRLLIWWVFHGWGPGSSMCTNWCVVLAKSQAIFGTRCIGHAKQCLGSVSPPPPPQLLLLIFNMLSIFHGQTFGSAQLLFLLFLHLITVGEEPSLKLLPWNHCFCIHALPLHPKKSLP